MALMSASRAERPVLGRLVPLLAGVLLLAGCAEFPPAPAPVAVVAAPRLAAGDRWVYAQINPYNHILLRTLTDTLETAPRGFTLVRQSDRKREPQRRRVVPAPWQLAAESGPLPRRFDPALVEIPFPLHPGSSWHQSVRVTDAGGRTYTWLTVGTALGWERVATPAGSFVALKIVLQMNLNDSNATWGDTQVFETLWYAPEVGRWVRRELRTERVEHACIPRVERDWKLWELTAYRLRESTRAAGTH